MSANPVIRVIANAHALGGGEMSICYTMELLLKLGCKVILHPTRVLTSAFPLPRGVDIGPVVDKTRVTECDILYIYANNYIYKLEQNRRQLERFMNSAKRVVVGLNFKVGQASNPWFFERVDEFGFLCTALQSQFLTLTKYPKDRTFVHAPTVKLAPYAKVKPDYSTPVLVRHSKANKWPTKTVEMLSKFTKIHPTMQYKCMGAPRQVEVVYHGDSRFEFQPAFSEQQPDFLNKGSIYWYPLNPDFTDQGPRTIMEAMLSGLPCMVDNRDGAADRVTPATGWLCSTTADYYRP